MITRVLGPDGKSALIGREHLQLDHVGGAGQQLGGLQQGAVLRSGAVDGQQDVAQMQRAAP